MINLEAIVIILSIDKHKIKIISVYNPPNKKILSEGISELYIDKPTIFLEELNSIKPGAA